ncbi:MAG: response regulator [Nitrospiraceae bacterium]|nr:response regulator [Nitrospiraceae bacterium]
MTDGTGSKPKILIVDNEGGNRFSYATVLTEAGYSVVTARSTEDAFTRIAETAFDLIYLDIALGPGSGIDVLREIKRKKLPVNVLMMTCDPNAASAKEAFELGAFGHISKPISREKLLRLTSIALRT